MIRYVDILILQVSFICLNVVVGGNFMKILLYFEGSKVLSKSGIGRALEHQKQALSLAGIEYTTDPSCVDYDILHINTYGINSMNMIKKARKMNKKIIYHAHTTEEDFRNSFVASNTIAPFLKKYLISLYARADFLLTPTTYSKHLLENYGLTTPIQAISNGIDLSQFQKDEEKEAKFREYFHVQPDEKVVICAGLFFERKGIVDFIEVAEKLPNYRFIWFGSTPLFSIPSHIRKLIKEDHPANVEFPGYIRGDVIEGAYSAADLFFFPSYEETEGIVVLEALASRQKVLVRDIPVYGDWLEDGVNCCKATTNQEFITKIQKMITEDCEELRDQAYLTAKQRNIYEIAQQLKEVYENVLNEHSKSMVEISSAAYTK